MKMSQMIHFKLYPEERATIQAALGVHPFGRKRGLSFFARNALVDWARMVLADHEKRRPPERKPRVKRARRAPRKAA